jgi:hypothetical protein
LPDDPDILAILTLFVAYQFRWLLMDSVRSDPPLESNYQDELNITLLLPLYIWPAYQIWVLQEFPAKAHITQGGAIPWLLNQKLRLQAFKELEIPEPGGKILAYLEVKKNTTNLSRWIKEGCERLRHVMKMATEDITLDATKGPNNPPQDEFDPASHPVENEISSPAEPTGEGRTKRARELLNACLASPIYAPYLKWKNALETCMNFMKTEPAIPSLCQIAGKIIQNQISSVGLDLHQQAQALVLLSELPRWIGIENASDKSISLRSIEIQWRQIQNSDNSPLIKALLETGLLKISSEEGRIRIADRLIHDFCLSMTRVKREHSTNPIPPQELDLTSWLYWMVCQWLETGDSHLAGITLWNAAGSLPGLNSEAWNQLRVILNHLPEAILHEPHIWLLVSIAREVIQNSQNSDHGSLKWVPENADFIRNPTFTYEYPRSEFDRIYEDYRDGLRRYV